MKLERERICVSEWSRKKYFCIYTCSFLGIALFCFSWFITSRRTLIWEGDGWTQHYKALVYYGRYLRQILRNLLFQHKLILPDWDFNISEGSDILTTLHYYVLGDPLAALSVFCPTRFMPYFYSLLNVFRLYLAGICFSALCYGVGKKNHIAILAGSWCYTFCYWGLVNAARHPYFLNPMIYFPLLLLGVERILAGRKGAIFILIVAISALSNFYFFYMLVLAVVIYVIVRVITLYKSDIKKIVRSIGMIALHAIIGVCMAGVIFLPVVIAMLHDTRIGIDRPFHLFYSLSYYSQLPALMLSNESPYWLCMGFAAPVLLAIFLLFRRKKSDFTPKIFLAICAVIILFPIFGRIFNGFSYMSNRWSWAFALLCCYILTSKWEALLSMDAKDARFLLICMAVYYGLCMLLENSRGIQAFASICLALFTLAIAYSSQREPAYNKKQFFLCMLIIINVIMNGFWLYSYSGYAEEAVEVDNAIKALALNETTALKKAADDDIVRYTSTNNGKNNNMLKKLSSTSYYWSNTNPNISQFRADLSILESKNYNYKGYDGRTALMALAAVNYYVMAGEQTADTALYGYKKIDTVDVKKKLVKEYLEELKEELGVDELTEEQVERIRSAAGETYTVYKNQYNLPLGYCYDSYITGDIWESLTASQKQELMLSTVYLSEDITDCERYTDSIPSQTIPYTVSCNSEDVTYENGTIITTAKNASLTIEFDGIENAETYVQLSGLEFDATSTYELYHGKESVDPLNLYNETDWKLLSQAAKAKILTNRILWTEPTATTISFQLSKEEPAALEYLTGDNNFTSGRKDYLANMGYHEEPVTAVTITFEKAGVYTLDSLEVVCNSMDGYEEKIAALKEDSLQNIVMDTDTMTGDITLERNKILCVAIPYTNGWRAYVDGEEAEILVANGHYLGIDLTAGTHSIKLIYRTPYKNIGAVVSVIGCVLFAVAVIASGKRKNVINTGERK